MQFRKPRRPGVAAMEVVMTTAGGVLAAAALYLLVERALDGFVFLLGCAVGWPY